MQNTATDDLPKFTTHLVNGLDVPVRIDILERFGVCLECDQKPIAEGEADGYYGVWYEDTWVGVWYFTIVDGLVGPKRTHLLNWPAMFNWLMQTVNKQLPDGFRLEGCRVRARCAPHLKTFQEGSTETLILF